MSYTVQYLVQSTLTLERVVQWFCEPRHSSVTVVDNLHSVIERQLPDETCHQFLCFAIWKLSSRVVKTCLFITWGKLIFWFLVPKLRLARTTTSNMHSPRRWYHKANVYKVAYANEMGGELHTAEVVKRKRTRSGWHPLPKPKQLGASLVQRKKIWRQWSASWQATTWDACKACWNNWLYSRWGCSLCTHDVQAYQLLTHSALFLSYPFLFVHSENNACTCKLYDITSKYIQHVTPVSKLVISGFVFCYSILGIWYKCTLNICNSFT